MTLVTRRPLGGSGMAFAMPAAGLLYKQRQGSRWKCCDRSGTDKRARKERLDYTSNFDSPRQVVLQTIGYVKSPYKERFGTPRQPQVSEQTLGNRPQEGSIHLTLDSSGRTPVSLALRGLEGFEYCWVITYFHLNQGWNPLVKPPRGPREKTGLFSTRAPHRPNSIGISALRITDVDHSKGIVHVVGLDLLDNTPVLDIKPYVPYCDAHPNAKAGWLDNLEPESMRGPDHLNYSPAPSHLLHDVDS